MFVSSGNASAVGNGGWLRQYLTIKTLSLVVLSVQTSTMVLLLRYSRTSNTTPYVITTAVLLSEIIKFTLAVGFLHIECGKILQRTIDRIYRDVLLNIFETLKLSIPAFLYVVQNNLLFIALTNLDAATYQVTYQLKILTTAIFSWVILGKRLRILHWLSLCFLMMGVSLVQVDVPSSIASSSSNSNSGNSGGGLNILPVVEAVVVDGDAAVVEVDANQHPDLQAVHPHPEVSWLLGVMAVFVSCISSGFSGVYFERLVKQGPQTSLVIRNIQLGIFSIVFAVMAVLSDGALITSAGFFQGYTLSTWAVILIQAFGGLMVSVTMKYADNILKGFATSLSIVLSTMVSVLILGSAAPTLQFVLGASIVIGSTVLYGLSPPTEISASLRSEHNSIASSSSEVFSNKVALRKKNESEIV